MAQGWQAGAVCFASAEAAASSLCASSSGVTSAGHLACTGATLVEGGAQLSYAVSNEAGTSTFTQTLPLHPCDRIAASDLTPIVGAVAVALCVIWAGKALLRVFDHQAV